ncbi:MAG: BREX protein BrxB domain-containing protein [Beijerinckiaceae bacterium]
MSAIDRLLSNYSRQVRLPWAANTSGKQRVWFAVYPPAEERRVRARLPQFEALTLEANHGWTTVDLTRLLPEWISAHEYREAIFEQPEHFSANNELEALAAERVRQACSREEADVSSVVAVTGLASLFDFMRVSKLIDRIEDNVRGRLLVFFPGEYAGNVYRFMDARDGFNYMAVPITSTESFIIP